MPEKTIKVNATSETKDVKWFDKELVNFRNTLQSLKIIDNVENTEQSKSAVNIVRSEYRKKIKEKKLLYNKKCIDASTNKARTMWQIVNQSRNNNSRSTNDLNNCNLNCDIFNNFFTNVTSNLVNRNDNIGCDNDPLCYMSNIRHVNVHFNFQEVSEAKVREVVDSFKNNNSTDVYGINMHVIKSIKNVILTPLTKLINLCIIKKNISQMSKN